jgi:hypothetical protein
LGEEVLELSQTLLVGSIGRLGLERIEKAIDPAHLVHENGSGPEGGRTDSGTDIVEVGHVDVGPTGFLARES